MNIFVDESGNFVPTSEQDSWCVVVAYASPEVDRAPLQRLMARLRASSGRETKLGELGEARYLAFLKELAALRGIFFAVAMDMSVQTRDDIVRHRDMQSEKVIEFREKMVHQSMRNALTELRDAVRSLPPQLYAQLVGQVELFHNVLTHGTLYFVQRWPATLGHFRWRVDRKNTTLTSYEQTFRRLLPALLQTKSMRDPMPMLEGANYSFFRRFEYGPDEKPSYLEENYGLKVGHA